MDETLNISIPGFVLDEGIQKNEILKKVRNYCGWRQDTFPGSQPVSLNQQKLESCIGRNTYVACEKTDGIRLLLYAASRRVFLIDRNQQVNVVNMTLPSTYWFTIVSIQEHFINNNETSVTENDNTKDLNFSSLNKELVNLNPNNEQHMTYFQQNTLLDGELVKDTFSIDDQKLTILRYLVYDCISIERDETIKLLPLLERLKNAYLKVIKPKILYDRIIKKFFGEMKQIKSDPFEIYIKDFFEVTDVPAILNFSKRLPHLSDGIIFTPLHLPYIPGTCPQLLKWKPPHLNTADFAAMFYSESDEYDSPIFLELLVGIRGVRASVNCFCAPVGPLYQYLIDEFRVYRTSGQILECFYDPNVVYYKPTKTHNGAIAWGEPLIAVQGGWVVERIRTDKNTPNDINTVNRVFESIRDGISSDVLINTINLYHKSGKKSVAEYCNLPDFVKKFQSSLLREN
ncbi:mRNA capping enzyme, putative [Cryptosporidium muris RN66]|uniref:mRNA guanylyltransferase n=1 Tax=Cryptosporidium muris (strain RN66) TaxID=441375 RepID=B6ADG8_CRYMR|nr:mRNA capping enzyme, putative [Cryptosporidium muris RN66]EEA06259.1 mRNA capping enzyme, putative [Cryptosporidium muris RN66]|eukprot:XP_002140608.1 mRNA capping enzyme [Cryptosporidium muris RN66]